MIRSACLTSSVSRSAGGLFDGVRRLTQELLDDGVDERVYGLEDEFTQADELAWSPVEVNAFKTTWPPAYGYSPCFLEGLLVFEPNLIHTHGIWNYPSVAATVFSRNRLRPYVVSPHGMLDPWAVQNSRLKKRIAFLLYEGSHLRGARCLRALCAQEARAIRQFGLKNEIAVIPNGVDIPCDTFTASLPWHGAIVPGRKVLLFLGRIHPKKGLIPLIRAWAELRNSANRLREADDWVLAIAGWDQSGHEQELKTLADSLGLTWTDIRSNSNGRDHAIPQTDDSSLVFLGPQFADAKSACYHGCEAFVLPSLSEGLPMTVLEAWAHAKPALMTAQCNLPAGFATGAALEIGTSAESINAGLGKLFGLSQSDRGAMGMRARQLAATEFSWQRAARDMKTVYEWVLGGGSRPYCMADN